MWETARQRKNSTLLLWLPDQSKVVQFADGDCVKLIQSIFLMEQSLQTV